MEQEIGIQGRHLKEVIDQVVDIFPKNNGDWKTLAVRFEHRDEAEWILRGKIKLRKEVVGQNRSVVENWVPYGLCKQYNGVRSLAYKFQRKQDKIWQKRLPPGHQTEQGQLLEQGGCLDKPAGLPGVMSVGRAQQGGEVGHPGPRQTEIQ